MRQRRSSAKVLSLCCYALSIASPLAAQVPDTWSPVPKEDLVLKDNTFNPGSDAMILERQIYTDDEKRSQTEWVRIKVFTEAGRGYADIEIPYVAKSTSIEDIRARTVRPDGTVILFSGAIFDREVIKYKKFRYQAKVFTLPGVEVGSVIEYAYTTRWKESMPDYVRKPYNYQLQPGAAFAFPTTTWTIQQDLFTRHAVFIFRPLREAHLDWAKVRMYYTCPCWREGGTVQLEVTSVPAIQKEDHMPPETTLNSRVHFFYILGQGSFWSSYGKARALKEEKFIEKTRFLEQAASQIAPPGDSPESRLRKLYARVQQVRYMSYEPTKTEQEAKRERLAENKSAEDILRHGYAYGNEVNLLFTALARAAGFDAWIVEVVDRTTGKFEPEVKDESQLNAMVVHVIVKNGKELYLDPASRFCPFGMLPWFESNTEGVAWDKQGGAVVDVHASEVEPSTIERVAELRLQPDGGLEGDLEVMFTGQEALDRRLLASDEDEAGRRKLLEDEIKEWTPGATLSVDSISGWQDTTVPLRVKLHLRSPRFAVVTQKRMLFPIGVFQGGRRRSFTYLQRVQPVYLSHTYGELDKVSILLPAGYSLETLSSGTELKTPFAEFRVTRTNESGVVRMERQAMMNRYFFPVESYSSLRQYFEQLRQSDAENVVLLQLESARAQ